MIRQMEQRDIRPVADMEQKIFGVPWSEGILQDCLNNNLYCGFVIEKDGELAGYVCFMAVAGELELLRIAVDGAFRRQGLAEKLMNRMLEWAEEKDIGDMTLEVRSRNLPAIRLYEKYGFKSEGIRKKYYHNPEDDALIMWKRCG